MLDSRVIVNLLVELAGLEEEAIRAEATLGHHERRTRDLGELLAEYEEDAAAAERGDQDAVVRLHSKECEIKAAETRLALKRDQIIGCTDRRAHQALVREITGLEQLLERLEEEALALLAETEAASSGRRQAQRDSQGRQAAGQAEIASLDQEARQARAARDALVEEIAAHVALLPEGIRRQVVRLRRKGGRAVVWLEGGACGGCFGQLPAQQAIDAGGGRAPVRCAGCACYVVHRPWR